MANTTQEAFISNLIDNKLPCTVITKNGFQIRCVIKSADNFTIVVEQNGVEQLVYKSAISTIAPGEVKKK